jgi:hypothetical protein
VAVLGFAWFSILIDFFCLLVLRVGGWAGMQQDAGRHPSRAIRCWTPSSRAASATASAAPSGKHMPESFCVWGSCGAGVSIVRFVWDFFKNILIGFTRWCGWGCSKTLLKLSIPRIKLLRNRREP